MRKDIIFNRENITTYIVVILVTLLFFLDIRPYFFWSVNIFFVKTLAFLFVFSVFINNKIYISIKNIVCFFIFILISILYIVSSNGIESGSLSFILVVAIYIFMPENIKEKTFMTVCNIYILLCAISLITFIYVYMVDSQHFSIIEPLNTVKSLSYRKYFFLVTPDEYGVQYFRFSGVFDEPGVVGTLSVLFLANNKIYNNKYKRLILILSGLFSMSLAFFILIIIFFCFKSYKTILVAFFSIILLYPVVKYIGNDNVIVEKFVIQRVDDLFTSSTSVNNRQSSYFNVIYNDFKNSNNVLLGNGLGQASLLDPEGFSYTHTIYDNGILYFILVNFFIGYYLFMGRITFKQSLNLFMILSLSLLQRPYYSNICMYVILFGYITDMDEISKNEQ